MKKHIWELPTSNPPNKLHRITLPLKSGLPKIHFKRTRPVKLPKVNRHGQRYKVTTPQERLQLPIKRRLSLKRSLPNWVKKETCFETWIPNKEMVAASIQKGTSKNYRAAGTLFYDFVKQTRQANPTLPTLQSMLVNLDLVNLDNLISEFLTGKFNRTRNSGGTLYNNASGILHCLAVDFGVVINAATLPGIGKTCKGADNILRDTLGDREKGKRALLNPILEQMFNHASMLETFALLVAQRFCLRSQHYCNNPTKRAQGIDTAEYLKMKHFHFIPNIDNPHAITLRTSKDKNHKMLNFMERTVYCSCKKGWTCIVHFAQNMFKGKTISPERALVQCRTGDMTSSAMMNIINTLTAKIGLDPTNYGTHSCRSGGTTEFFLEKKSALWIQQFGWWKNLSSVQHYLKPNNPDLDKFVNSTTEYIELRGKQSLESDSLNYQKHTKNQQAMNRQENKRRRGYARLVANSRALYNSPKIILRPKRQVLFNHQTGRQPQHIYTDYSAAGYNYHNHQWHRNINAPPRAVVTSSLNNRFAQPPRHQVRKGTSLTNPFRRV